MVILAAPHAYAANAQVTISSGAANTKGTCSQTSCFNPQITYINVGDTVTWTNADSVGHTATSGNPSDNQTGTVFDSSVIASGSSYTSPAFNTPGTYNYFCQVHPWMTGQVVVSNRGSTTTTPPIQETLNVNVSPTTGFSPLQVSYSASFSSGNSMKSIVWNFGDGNSASGIAYGTHIYQSAGSYTGTVDVESMDGTSYTQAFFVTVTGNITPTANIIISNGASNTHGTCTATSCFNPNIFSANVGQYVTWYNADTVGHTVTSGNPSDNRTGTVFDSSLITPGRTYGFTFQSPGTYNYFCQVHPWMTGQVIVGGGAVSSPPPTYNPPSQYNPSPNTVIISNGAANTRGTCSPTDCYNPQVININVGSSVTWTNEDVVGHTVTSGHPSDNQTGTVFDSSLIASGRSYTSPAFNTPGTYPYFCQVHPWMTGEIIVGQGGQSLPPTTTSTGFSVSTDKSSYSSGSTVTITTYSSGISAGQNVAILVTDPLSNVVASRTIQFNSQGYAVLQIGLSPTAPSGTYQVTASASVDGNYLKGSASFVTVASVTAPPVSSGVSIVSVQATNQLGNNVVTSYGKGTTGFAKVVISSASSQSALITVNLVGSDGTSLGVGSIDTSLGTGTSQMIVSFYIPAGASVGTANIYADVYSDWPTNGGTPLTPESSSEVGIQ